MNGGRDRLRFVMSKSVYLVVVVVCLVRCIYGLFNLFNSMVGCACALASFPMVLPCCCTADEVNLHIHGILRSPCERVVQANAPTQRNINISTLPLASCFQRRFPTPHTLPELFPAGFTSVEEKVIISSTASLLLLSSLRYLISLFLMFYDYLAPGVQGKV
jgi:hypothetical protein